MKEKREYVKKPLREEISDIIMESRTVGRFLDYLKPFDVRTGH